MAIILPNTTIQRSDGALRMINANGQMSVQTDGLFKNAYQSFFTAARNDGWSEPAIGWSELSFQVVPINNSNCFNGTRFTAPYAGTYGFIFSSYCNRISEGNPNNYIHPFFLVNGSAVRRANAPTYPYRLRGYQMYYPYYFDLEIIDIIRLQQNDYVSVNLYNTGMNQMYGGYTGVAGVYLG